MALKPLATSNLCQEIILPTGDEKSMIRTIGNFEATMLDKYGNRHNYNIVNTETQFKLSLTYSRETSIFCLEDLGVEVLQDYLIEDNDRWYLNMPHEYIKDEWPHLYV